MLYGAMKGGLVVASIRTIIGASFLALLLTVVIGVSAVSAQNRDDIDLPQISDEALADLIILLEDDTQRKKFVEHLKTLKELQAKKKAEPSEVGAQTAELIDGIFGVINRITTGTMVGIRGLISLASKAPETAARIWSECRDPAGRRAWGKLLVSLAVSLAAGLVLHLSFSRLLRRQPTIRLEWGRRSLWGLASLLLRLMPYVVTLVVYAFLAEWLEGSRVLRDTVFLIISTGVVYLVVLAVVRMFIDPARPHTRLLTINDEDSRRVWNWIGKISRYALVYYLITRLGALWCIEEPVMAFLRGCALLAFGGMLTVMVFHIRSYMNQRVTITFSPEIDADDTVSTSRTKRRIRQLMTLLLRYWWIPASGYIWAMVLLTWARLGNALRYMGLATLNSLIVLVLLALVRAAFTSLLDRLEHSVMELGEKFPISRGLPQRYVRYLRVGVNMFLWLVALGGVAQAWGVPVWAAVTSALGLKVIGSLAAILFTMLVVIGLIEISRSTADRMLRPKYDLEPGQKIKTFVPIIRTGIIVAAIFVGAIIILRHLGIDVGPILAGAGIISLGVGLGAQSLVKDVINGLFILLQDLISVGDVAGIGGKTGVVESVGLRTVQLRDLSGNVHTVPNSTIDTVTNMTKGYSRYVLDIGVAYREDVDEVIAVLTEIGKEMQADETFGPDILEPLEILGVNELGDSAVVVRARVTTKPVKQWAVGREFLRRIKKTFDARGIEIPFPHRTVYMGEPKQGPSPALYVQVKDKTTSEA
jgi:moderate conductance mechanosensitive channel